MDYANSGNRNSCESTSIPSNGNGKNRARTGGGKRGKTVKLSTDPQSIAARQRRRRISDRFKILQSLVPGGSKMDTVSMLEQAIQYVKFLKAQIWLHEMTTINLVNNEPVMCFRANSLPFLSDDHNLCPETGYYATQFEPFTEVGLPSSCFQSQEFVPSDAYYSY